MLKKLFFLIWSNSAIILTGQSHEDLFLFAQSQYLNGNYEVALKEYHRYLFFSSEIRPNALQAIADCYRKLGSFEKAADFYDKTFYSTSSDSLRLIALFNKAECEIQLNEFGLALIDLLGYVDSVKDDAKQKWMFLCGVCYFGMDDFGMAETSFIEALDKNQVLQIKQIQEIFRNKKLFNHPNPKTAYILSSFIPGLGQFYSGDIKNGFNSFLLTTFLAGVGIRIAVNQTIMDGIFTIFPWFQRYYQGGVMKAENIATEKRKRHRADAFSDIIEIIASAKE